MITNRLAFCGGDAGDYDDLFRYYTQSGQFPETILVRRNASPPCCQFIKSTMAASPDDRPKARDLVRHDWLTRTSPSMERPPQTDNELRFGSHVSISSDQDPVSTDPSASWRSVEYTEASWPSQTKRDTILQSVRDKLISMNNLASTRFSQRKYEEAEPIYRETVELRKKVLGREHPDTLTSMKYLAAALFNQRKDKEAEPIYRETVELRKKVLGREIGRWSS
jgi:hypothetical protein